VQHLVRQVLVVAKVSVVRLDNLLLEHYPFPQSYRVIPVVLVPQGNPDFLETLVLLVK
jgi:hypothetical protein